MEVEWVSQNMDSWQQREEQRGKAKESSGGHRRSVTVESIGDTGMVGWGAERKRAGVEGGGEEERERRSSKVVALVEDVLESHRVWRDKVSNE